MAGALFAVCIVFGCKSHRIGDGDNLLTDADGGVFDRDPWRSALITSTTTRQVTPTWHMIFLRGLGCNWLVCLGCFFAIQGRDLTAKVVGLYWPIFAFVSLGFDHVVSNLRSSSRDHSLTGATGRQYVLHSHGHLDWAPTNHRRPVHLEGHSSCSSRKLGWRQHLLWRILLHDVFLAAARCIAGGTASSTGRGART